MMFRALSTVAIAACVLLPVCGCQRWLIDSADREVASLIESRQRASLGMTADARIGRETGRIGSRAEMYSFVPSAMDANVPEPFRRATTPQDPADPAETEPTDEFAVPQASEESPSDAPESPAVAPRPFALSDALAYAMRHSRAYQSAKERLYLAALDLTLERHLWTPRFVTSVLSVDYANFGQVRDFDRAMTAVSTFAVEQRLPYGGEITAQVINTLMRDLGVNTTSGESGQFIITTRLPFLRGAGPVAYEDRYRGERQLIYAVRAFERFRREFLVDVASDYFQLLSLKAQIASAQAQAASLQGFYRREQALADAERIIQIEADRARVSMLNAENESVNAQERYDTSLDAFKIRLGMPTRTPIDAIEEEIEIADPHVEMQLAVETALKYRLDLLTAGDVIDDARRAVEVARNNMLPQFDLNASMAMNTDPDRTNSASYNAERTTWRASLDFEIPLERKRERNDYRSSLIGLRRAERDFEEFADTVRLEVRRALRRLDQARSTLVIQKKQIEINIFRAAQAEAKLKVGQLPSNRDVVEAQDDLSDARNRYADAQSQFRRVVLEFLRDTGTLRIGDDGKWIRYDAATGAPLPPAEIPDMPPDAAPNAPKEDGP